jgi:hypothetical protein
MAGVVAIIPAPRLSLRSAAARRRSPRARRAGGQHSNHRNPAVTAALTDPASDRDALAEQLEERARRAEEGEQEGSPYLELAAHLRTLAARLGASEGDKLPTDSA